MKLSRRSVHKKGFDKFTSGTGDKEKANDLKDTDISNALGGLEINSCANVGAVAAAVAEGADEIGTVYYSDTFGYEDNLEIIEKLPNSLTGDVILPWLHHLKVMIYLTLNLMLQTNL